MKIGNLIALLLVAACAFFFVLRRPPVSNDPALTPTVIIHPKSGGEMVPLSGGAFEMGSAAGRADETPHRVAIRSIAMDKNLVTQEFFERVMAKNPSKHKGPTNPVDQVTWWQAIDFCNQCSVIDGLNPCYDLKTGACNFDADGYRLPTEAEYEYACRAGGKGQYAFGDDASKLAQYAWCKPHSGGKPHPVGQKAPNAFGLCDMTGNVWEWCNDWYSETYYKEGQENDPRGPESGKKRVLRGGAWDSTAEKCRAAYRHSEFPNYADVCLVYDSYGFRRVRCLTGEPADKFSNTPPGMHAASGQPMKTAAAPVAPKTPEAKPGKLDASALKGEIVFASDRSGTLKIWKMKATGKDAVQLTKDENPDASPQFSPDGATILYTTLRGGFPEIWTMKRDGSAQQHITKGAQAAWSPDGKQIAFVRENQTFMRELASGKERLVSPDKWDRCGAPAWSPDGQRIAISSRHQEDVGIYLLSIDGKDPLQLKTADPSCTPAWSSDGKRMLCQTTKGHVHQFEPAGKNWEQLTFEIGLQHDARYSPDGTMLIYAHALYPQGPWQIRVQRLEDEDSFVELTLEGSNLQPCWSEK